MDCVGRFVVMLEVHHNVVEDVLGQTEGYSLLAAKEHNYCMRTVTDDSPPKNYRSAKHCTLLLV